MAKSVKPTPALILIKPVPGYFLNGVPALEQLVSPDEAADLVATGAFAHGGAPDDAEVAPDSAAVESAAPEPSESATEAEPTE